MCPYIHCANQVTVGADAVVLDFTKPVNAINRDHVCFKLCQEIPAAGASLPVQVTVNGTAIPLWNKYGNPVLGSQLTRRKYIGYYGSTTPHVIISNSPTYCGCEKAIY